MAELQGCSQRGRTTYLITTLARVPAGTEGAVSAEGTAAGVVGSFALAGYAVAPCRRLLQKLRGVDGDFWGSLRNVAGLN